METFYRLFKRKILGWKESKLMFQWRKHPGCFERHLQRRYNNVLFPFHRRNITNEDVEQARKKDDYYESMFYNKYAVVLAWIKNPDKENSPVDTVSDFYRNMESLIDEAYSIGGDHSKEINVLQEIANNLREALSKKMPNVKEYFEVYSAGRKLQRIGYLRQLNREDSPILNEDDIPSLLSEDGDTIERTIALVAATMDNIDNYRNDVIANFERAYLEGFDENRGKAILESFDSGVKIAKLNM
jgi:hypothetical protein